MSHGMNPALLGIGMAHVQQMPDGRFVQVGSEQRGRNPLGDAGSVMMISGLGAEGSEVQTPQTSIPSAAPIQLTQVAGPGLSDQLNVCVTLFGLKLPVWAWLLIAASLGAGGGYWYGSKK